MDITVAGVFDLETTGFDSAKDHIIEIGAVLWDMDNLRILETYSSFVDVDVVIPEKITHLTGIHQEDLCRGKMAHTVLNELDSFMMEAQYIMAHNGREFDKPFLENWVKRSGYDRGMSMFEKPLIDTQEDLPYGEGFTQRSLIGACAEHGFVNPWPHKAMFDAAMTAKLSGYYKKEIVIARALAPRLTYIAQFPKPFGATKDLGALGVAWCRENKFRWDGEQKIWSKLVNELDSPTVEGKWGEFHSKFDTKTAQQFRLVRRDS